MRVCETPPQIRKDTMISTRRSHKVRTLAGAFSIPGTEDGSAKPIPVWERVQMVADCIDSAIVRVPVPRRVGRGTVRPDAVLLRQFVCGKKPLGSIPDGNGGAGCAEGNANEGHLGRADANLHRPHVGDDEIRTNRVTLSFLHCRLCEFLSRRLCNIDADSLSNSEHTG
jgi:hypothetical protein